jgi:hypothetical protein
MEEFADFSLVAQGGYGIVFSAWNLTDGCQYAIKIIYHGYAEKKIILNQILIIFSSAWWRMR